MDNAPHNTRIIGSSLFPSQPRVEYEDLAEPIDGTFETLGGIGFQRVWIFTPTARFQPGRRVRVALDSFAGSMTFTTTQVADLEAPSIAGLSNFTVDRVRFDEVVGPTGGQCVSPTEGSSNDYFRMSSFNAADNLVDSSALIYTYRFTGNGPPLEVVSLSYQLSSSCPGFDIGRVPSSPCLTIEAQDPAGNTARSAEVCGAIVDRAVRYEQGSCTDIAPLPDAGPTPEPDGGEDRADGSTAIDAGTGGLGEAEEVGCGCNNTRTGDRSVLGLLLGGLLLLIRRRFTAA